VTEGLRNVVLDSAVTADDLLESPYLAFGTEEEIAEHLLRVREETGTSYFVVSSSQMDAFGPVVHRLTNFA
jgi:hypothetical protein